MAIPVIEDKEQYYDLYPIPFPIEYEETADSYGVIGQGAAKLLNIEQYYIWGYQCLKISQMLHSSEDCVFQKELMPN